MDRDIEREVDWYSRKEHEENGKKEESQEDSGETEHAVAANAVPETGRAVDNKATDT